MEIEIQPNQLSTLPHERPHDTRGLRLVVSGSRYQNSYAFVADALDVIAKNEDVGLLIHGGAPGVDTLAGAWARRLCIPVCVFTANWEQQGSNAGVIRNQAMIDWGKPDLAVVFPGNFGTADMRRRVEAAGIRLIAIGAAK